MKLLSIIVPCYNSEDYINHCIDSLLLGGNEVEILIVNDGSTDRTAEIAERYMSNYPEIIRCIHQENGGHGAAVTTGIENATGKYIKVVDSDDWVTEAAYREVLYMLHNFSTNNSPDMVITNFVYEKVGKKHKKVMQYKNVFPTNKVFTWAETGHFSKEQYMLMHSIIYKTEVLKNSPLQLPTHTFYVDNLYAYIPLLSVQSIFYIDVDFYHYYIGRKDQSVQENIMIERIDQQVLVNKMMVTAIDINTIESQNKKAYMLNYLEIITMISSVLLMRSHTAENRAKKNSFGILFIFIMEIITINFDLDLWAQL